MYTFKTRTDDAVYFDPQKRTIERAGTPSPLDESAARVLEKLLATTLVSPNQHVSTNDLVRAGWPDRSDADKGDLQSAISRIRKALGETRKGSSIAPVEDGYLFTSSVDELPNGRPAPLPERRNDGSRPNRGLLWPLMATALAATVAAVLFSVWWTRRDPGVHVVLRSVTVKADSRETELLSLLGPPMGFPEATVSIGGSFDARMRLGDDGYTGLCWELSRELTLERKEVIEIRLRTTVSGNYQLKFERSNSKDGQSVVYRRLVAQQETILTVEATSLDEPVSKSLKRFCVAIDRRNFLPGQ